MMIDGGGFDAVEAAGTARIAPTVAAATTDTMAVTRTGECMASICASGPVRPRFCGFSVPVANQVVPVSSHAWFEQRDATKECLLELCSVRPRKLWGVGAQQDQPVQGDPQRGGGDEGILGP